MVIEEFGVLKHRDAVVFNGGSIEALYDVEDTLQKMEKAVNPDGFLYPLTQHTVTTHRRGQEFVEEIVPQSQRPAHLFWIPATHQVSVSIPLDSDVKRGDAGFLIHLCGYLWGTRVQFADWQVDGRVPFTRSTHGAIIMGYEASPFFSIAYDYWRNLPPTRRQAITNILYMHTRTPSYEWIWERFLFEYVVFDNLWKYLSLPNRGHSKRIEQVCSHLNMDFDSDATSTIVDLRNNLVHEAIWEGDTPGFATSQRGWDSVHQLRSLNHKAIASTLGWTGKYIGSSWAHYHMSEFFD